MTSTTSQPESAGGTAPASGDPRPDSTSDPAQTGNRELAGLAGCGPEFLLLEIEIMRLEGVVTRLADDPEQGPGS